MVRSILFDFNGVIIDDEPVQMTAYQESLGAEGITLTEQDYYGALGMDDVTFVRSQLERAGRAGDDDLAQRLIERKTELHRRAIKDDLPLFPGVVSFVIAAARQFSLALVSMARRADITHVLERAGLDGLFTVLVSAEDVRAPKPDPDCYRRAFKLLDETRIARGGHPLTPDQCVVIEDAPPGILAARAAGMRTLGVTNTVPEEDLRRAGADVVTRSLADWTTDAVHHVFDTAWH